MAEDARAGSIARKMMGISERAPLPPRFKPTILRCGRERIPDQRAPRDVWQWRGLHYPYWRIYWNQQPGLGLSYQGKEYLLDPEFVVVVTPNAIVDHSMSGPVDHFYVHLALGYPWDRLAPQVLRIPVAQLPMHLLDDLLAHLLKAPESHTLTAALGWALYAYVSSVLASVPAEIWPESPRDHVLENLLGEIAAHPERPWRTADMAAHCYMSVNTLLRRFKEHVGEAPQHVLIDYRLQKACRLLAHTNDSINEIAEACGYANRYAFSRAFSRHRGHGPAAFRSSC